MVSTTTGSRIEPKLAHGPLSKAFPSSLSLFDDKPRRKKRVFCPPKSGLRPGAEWRTGGYGKPLPSFTEMIEAGNRMRASLFP